MSPRMVSDINRMPPHTRRVGNTDIASRRGGRYMQRDCTTKNCDRRKTLIASSKSEDSGTRIRADTVFTHTLLRKAKLISFHGRNQ